MLDPKVKVSRRIVRPGLRIRHYGGGDIRSDGQVPMATDLDFNSVGLPKNLPGPANDGDAARKKFVVDSIAAALGSFGARRVVTLRLTADQNNGGSPAVLAWSAADVNDAAMWAIGAPTDIVIKQAGFYLCMAQVTIDDGGRAGVAGFSVGGVGKTGTQDTKNVTTFGDGYPYINIFYAAQFAVNDVITVTTAGMTGAGVHVVKGTAGATYCAVMLLATNASGGGDFLSNGSIPMTGPLDFGGQKAINSADPTTPLGLTTKQYVDAAIAAVVAGIAAPTYKKTTPVYRTANVAVPGAFADIPGLTTGNFTVKAGGSNCEIKFFALYAFNHVSTLSIRVDIDGGAQVFDFTDVSLSVGAGSDNVGQLPVPVSLPINLGAGVHVVKIRHMANANATLVASAAGPASLVVDYQ